LFFTKLTDKNPVHSW